jgi:hypothetical protein
MKGLPWRLPTRNAVASLVEQQMHVLTRLWLQSHQLDRFYEPRCRTVIKGRGRLSWRQAELY